MTATHQEWAPPFTLPLFARIADQWEDYKLGHPPSRHHGGRGAQNPWLLRAFNALDRALNRAKRYHRAEEERRQRWAAQNR